MAFNITGWYDQLCVSFISSMIGENGLTPGGGLQAGFWDWVREVFGYGGGGGGGSDVAAPEINATGAVAAIAAACVVAAMLRERSRR